MCHKLAAVCPSILQTCEILINSAFTSLKLKLKFVLESAAEKIKALNAALYNVAIFHSDAARLGPTVWRPGVRP